MNIQARVVFADNKFVRARPFAPCVISHLNKDPDCTYEIQGYKGLVLNSEPFGEHVWEILNCKALYCRFFGGV
jgi:hypothetical protein